MAKVNIRGLVALEKNIENTFTKVRESKQMRKDIGEFVVGRIKAEARRTKPLNDSRSFPGLKDSSKSIRKYLAALNPTHPTYKATRSNLTLTGQLINAIVYRLTGKSVLVIEVEDSIRDPYIKNRKGEIGDVKTNREVDKDLRKRGFVLYTAKGIDSEPRVGKRINNIVKKYVRRAIKVNFGS
jgi:hypothetical protein